MKRWNVRYFYLYNSIQSSVVSISLIRHITNTSNIVHPPLDNSLNITFWASWQEKCQISRRNVQEKCLGEVSRRSVQENCPGEIVLEKYLPEKWLVRAMLEKYSEDHRKKYYIHSVKYQLRREWVLCIGSEQSAKLGLQSFLNKTTTQGFTSIRFPNIFQKTTIGNSFVVFKLWLLLGFKQFPPAAISINRPFNLNNEEGCTEFT